MWTHSYEEKTNLSPEQIWPILADIERWPTFDSNIKSIQVFGEPSVGTKFTLQPKGGPKLKFSVGEFDPPKNYSDICHLFLAKMTTRHSLLSEEKTIVRVRIEISGPLSWFWGLAVGRKHAAGLPAQTAKILAAVEKR
jgi:hypothetical protein